MASDHQDNIPLFGWTVRVNESFSIVFYFDDGVGFSLEYFIGSVDAFRGTTPETCANCASNNDLIAEGSVHLNYFIGRDISIFDLPKVFEYLKEKKLSLGVAPVSDVLLLQ